MAPRKTSSSSTVPQSPISIGNCEVSVEAKKYACESEVNSLRIYVSRNLKIRISVKDEANAKSHVNGIQGSKSEEKGMRQKDDPNGVEFSFLLVNPKDVNSSSRSYLQEVLELYASELPTMKYAANTGKQSTFLERCVTNGKYCTLLFKCMPESGAEVIAAITYQIVPADTQYAEIPLAAVRSIHQKKGVGRILFTELRNRLQSIGVCSIICWGDKESEGFWQKQGFVSVAEVDVKGRTRRLPIKADIRKALSFPGGSTLMVSHLKDVSAQSTHSLKLDLPLKPNGKSCSAIIEAPLGVQVEVPNSMGTMNQTTPVAETSQLELLLVNDSLSKEGSQSAPELPRIGANDGVKNCSCSTQRSGAKRVWEASVSSLKSKKVKGGHLVGCESGYNFNRNPKSGEDCSCYHTCPSVTLEKSSSTLMGKVAVGEIISEASVTKDLQSDQQCFKIMLMNIADDTKKAKLTKVIVDLGGIVTSNGSSSTHVITGKVRATLNFCTALCSGAWVVAPHWLKECFRQGKFVDELPYLLNDEEYSAKYRAELRTAVFRAKANPGALLKGYDVCLTTHGQPSVKPMSTIVKSAGGNIIGKLSQVNAASKTIFVAHEDDMEEAILAARRGVLTFNSDWLMNCIMKQELDFEAPQFAVSL